MGERLTQEQAVALLQGLVTVPSVSREEAQAAAWLVEQMRSLGYDRAFVDEAGNAVGEVGPEQAEATVVLLGHIDTVPGAIPVRIEPTTDGPVLYGRGSVDAKGPLATFTAGVARLGSAWAHAHDIRLVVVGAVEEEAATSKGARFIRARFDGEHEPIPAACIIGEPSSAQRITLGYKGRVLLEMEAAQPMAHTAGPDPGVATVAVDFWNTIAAEAATFNQERPRAFDQLLPSLRSLQTWTDEALQDRVRAQVGVRLPPDFDIDSFLARLMAWAAERTAAPPPQPLNAAALGDGFDETVHFPGAGTSLSLRVRAYEPAWRSERNTPLVRAFLSAIRSVSGARPSFVVKTGTSDMNVVGPAWGCPIVAYGPGDSSLDHTPNEHVHLDEYWQAVLVLEQALMNLGDGGLA